MPPPALGEGGPYQVTHDAASGGRVSDAHGGVEQVAGVPLVAPRVQDVAPVPCGGFTRAEDRAKENSRGAEEEGPERLQPFDAAMQGLSSREILQTIEDFPWGQYAGWQDAVAAWASQKREPYPWSV